MGAFNCFKYVNHIDIYEEEEKEAAREKKDLNKRRKIPSSVLSF